MKQVTSYDGERFSKALESGIDDDDPIQVLYACLLVPAFYGREVEVIVPTKDGYETATQWVTDLDCARKILDSLLRQKDRFYAGSTGEAPVFQIGFAVDDTLPEGVIDGYSLRKENSGSN